MTSVGIKNATWKRLDHHIDTNYTKESKKDIATIAIEEFLDRRQHKGLFFQGRIYYRIRKIFYGF